MIIARPASGRGRVAVVTAGDGGDEEVPAAPPSPQLQHTDQRQKRHMANTPVRNMDQPMMGMRKLEVLEMNLKSRCRWNRV